MKKLYLEAGKIVNTHGVRGEIKIQPWCNGPEFLSKFKRIFIDGKERKIRSSRVSKEMVVMALEDVNTIDDAIILKNKIIYIDRNDVRLPKGEYFIQDLIGLKVIDAETEREIGVLNDIIPSPAGNIYEVKGQHEILIPAVPEFIIEKDPDAGIIKVRLIEGM